MFFQVFLHQKEHPEIDRIGDETTISSGMPQLTQREVMQEAFRYREALIAYAYGLLRDWSLAEDAVQEAFLVLLDKWREYKPEYKVYTWVRRMVFYKVQELSRSRKREQVSQDEELFGLVRHAIDRYIDEDAAARQGQMLKALRLCMAKLDASAARILVSYYWDRLSCDQIAAQLKRTVNAVWLALSRTRKKLRQCAARELAEMEAVR